MKIMFIYILVIPLVVFAKIEHVKGHVTQHKTQRVHDHGSGTLGLVIEGLKGNIEFEIPCESIFGFEYAAKSDKDKAKRDGALAILENKISEMIIFDGELNCKIIKEKINILSESSKHSDLTANYAVSCDRSPLGTEIVFNFHDKFPMIKKIKVSIIIDNLQKSVKVDKSNIRQLLK